jgi:hypothetical protein
LWRKHCNGTILQVSLQANICGPFRQANLPSCL